MLPKFNQHIECATRGANILDTVYSNIKQGFRAKQLAHLGQSDHMSLLSFPAYIPLRKSVSTTFRTVRLHTGGRWRIASIGNYREVWKGVNNSTGAWGEMHIEENQPDNCCRTWWHPRMSVEGMRGSAGWGLYHWFFNQSLSQATLPLCLKSATIVPLQNKTEDHYHCPEGSWLSPPLYGRVTQFPF